MLLTSRKTPWLRVVKGDPFAPLRVFCFAYAGAGANAYRSWGEAMEEHVEIAAVQLPGRETRMRERPFTAIAPLVDALLGALLPYLQQKPFAFFGHSMGALLSFELTRELRRLAGPMPEALFVSGRRAPDSALDPRDSVMHRMTDVEILEELREMNGTESGVMEHDELLSLLLPIFRADFSVCENWRYRPEEALAVPIHALGGLLDPAVSRAHLEGWQRQTTADFTLDMFPGDHFYVNGSRQLLLDTVSGHLRQYVLNPAPKREFAEQALPATVLTRRTNP